MTDDPRYSRSTDVCWRLAPDRVLVRRPHAGDDGAADLIGDAALVWIALDDPAPMGVVVERLVEAGVTVPPPDGLSDVVDGLLAGGWIVRVA